MENRQREETDIQTDTQKILTAIRQTEVKIRPRARTDKVVQHCK